VVITREPIAPPASPPPAGVGAVAAFWGVVRADGTDPRVASIHYEAYPPLAERVIDDIIDQARSRYAIDDARITHRVGDVPVGEASLLVEVESRHRADAFAALAWIVDEIKERLPVWKKERYDDGSSRWL
jgi:molybdopterin synthase catalytic subunit